MPSANREDYLKQILLHQQGNAKSMPMGTLAQAVGVASASVTGMVKSLVDVGFVKYEPYAGVKLTSQGEVVALRVLRRHRLIELFLVKTLDVDWAAVHEEAEKIEHVISEELLERIDSFLGRPEIDPHGDPIPRDDGMVDLRTLSSLAEAEAGRPFRIARVLDQDPAFLRFIEQQDIKPGTRITVESRDDQAHAISVRLRGKRVTTLGITAAAKILVTPA
jgi:DtxR family Mn-dependent transcriptional regulator